MPAVSNCHFFHFNWHSKKLPKTGWSAVAGGVCTAIVKKLLICSSMRWLYGKRWWTSNVLTTQEREIQKLTIEPAELKSESYLKSSLGLLKISQLVLICIMLKICRILKTDLFTQLFIIINHSPVSFVNTIYQKLVSNFVFLDVPELMHGQH
jgi:hypothetical protein